MRIRHKDAKTQRAERIPFLLSPERLLELGNNVGLVVLRPHSLDSDADGVGFRSLRLFGCVPDPALGLVARSESYPLAGSGDCFEIRPLLFANLFLSRPECEVEIAALCGKVSIAGLAVGEREGAPDLDSLRGVVGWFQDNPFHHRIYPHGIACHDG